MAGQCRRWLAEQVLPADERTEPSDEKEELLQGRLLVLDDHFHHAFAVVDN